MDLAFSSWIAIGTGILILGWGITEIFIKSAVFTTGRWLYIVHRDTNAPMYWIAVGLKFVGSVAVLVGAFAVPAFTNRQKIASKIDDQAAAAADSASAAAAAASAVPAATHTTTGSTGAPKHAATGVASAASSGSKSVPGKPAKPGK
jgi:hypothetical protein